MHQRALNCSSILYTDARCKLCLVTAAALRGSWEMKTTLRAACGKSRTGPESRAEQQNQRRVLVSPVTVTSWLSVSTDTSQKAAL